MKKWKEENKQHLKEYYQNNRDDILMNVKQHRQRNKDKMIKRRIEKIICECGSIVTLHCIGRPKKSKTHHRLMGH